MICKQCQIVRFTAPVPSSDLGPGATWTEGESGTLYRIERFRPPSALGARRYLGWGCFSLLWQGKTAGTTWVHPWEVVPPASSFAIRVGGWEERTDVLPCWWGFSGGVAGFPPGTPGLRRAAKRNAPTEARRGREL